VACRAFSGVCLAPVNPFPLLWNNLCTASS